jgi:hypothetical protein
LADGLVTKRFQKGDAESVAEYSPCERYRYSLTRVWNSAAPKVMFVMLNPSKATEQQNDPTIERCERRARTLGFGGFRATNIFAWRETDPTRLREALEPIGPSNDSVVLRGAEWADMTLAAWGVHGLHLGRGAEVEILLRNANHALHHLGLTKAGLPRHPLYVAYAQRPELWSTER